MRIRAWTCGRLSSGRVNSTSMGVSWVTVTMPELVSELVGVMLETVET